jgi:hypothetical protein
MLLERLRGAKRPADGVRCRNWPISGSAGQFGIVAARVPARDRAQFRFVFKMLASLASLASYGIIDPVAVRNSRGRTPEHGAIACRSSHISTSQPTASRKFRSSRPLCSVFWANWPNWPGPQIPRLSGIISWPVSSDWPVSSPGWSDLVFSTLIRT